MPVRLLTQSVMRWPDAHQVLGEVADWAEGQGQVQPSLQRVAVFGSYGRGTAGVGSDLDLLLIDAAAEGPQFGRLQHWPLELLPLSCDALVLTPGELDTLMASGQRMARELQRDARWIWERPRPPLISPPSSSVPPPFRPAAAP